MGLAAGWKHHELQPEEWRVPVSLVPGPFRRGHCIPLLQVWRILCED